MGRLAADPSAYPDPCSTSHPTTLRPDPRPAVNPSQRPALNPTTPHPTPRPSVVARILIGAIRVYQQAFSPYKGGPSCRFTPTCSAYALTAVQRHGALRGGLLALARLVKCGPWHPGGWDPVPPSGKGKRRNPARGKEQLDCNR
ncbi:MAG: membrane protein insertion efficiency factor YidD [Bifidobacterium sp.]|nr:membrane protein insertion efficiency factor YidD [Bifidobacterium sp.]